MSRDTIIVLALVAGAIALVVLSQRTSDLNWNWRALVNRAQGGAYGAR